MKQRLADYVADFLVKHNITDVFSVVGGGAMHLNDALGHKEGMKVTYNHHEQACAIAAEAYARLMKRKLALVCVTSGPGGTNAITGVMGGWLDSIPMFIISGQVKTETTIQSCPNINLRQLGDQEFDIINTVSNMTKFSVMITEPHKIAYYLEKAYYLALSGRPGPVWIDIPLDMQAAQIETDELIHFTPSSEECGVVPELSDKDAVSLLDKIFKAKAPLILAGTGIHLSDAEEEFLQLLDKLDIPVVTAWNANDTVPFEHPCFAGMPGTVGTRGGNFVLQNCDLLLSLGCRMNIRMIGYNHFDFAKNAYKVAVDIDAAELQKPTVQIDYPIHADLKQVLKALLKQEYSPNIKHTEWKNWCQQINKKYPVVQEQFYYKNDLKNGFINPYVFMDMLFSKLDAHSNIICSNGSACVMTFQACKIKSGQRMFTNSGCAAMGYGLPAAIGAAVAQPNSRTICLEGDGSIMMNLQELQTVAYHQYNIKLIIINNNGYHSIRQTQTNLFTTPLTGVSKENGVSFPDFKQIAAAFQIPYVQLIKEENAIQIIENVLNRKGPVILEVIVDYNQKFEPKSSSKILSDGSMVSTSLDDMFPFLEQEEYLNNRYTEERE